MTTREARRTTVMRLVVAVLTLSPLAPASTARAADGADPVVVESKSALPRDCVSLGEISAERMMATSPKAERVQADAVKEAKEKGATHMVTNSLEQCGPYSMCYEGVAYRCPAPGGAPAGK